MLAYVILHKNDVLDRLQRLGAEIAIDDFGTLYSSLDYLKTYHVNRVKIPRSMIEAGARDPVASAMIWAIVDLGHALGIDVVAQGVETRAQLALLSGAPPTTKVQGFFVSAPVPAAEATQALSHQALADPRKAPVSVVSTGFREGYYGEGYYR
jgi:EAL domain-containing protein (putative c-di-GMP-specific phosphodiesterase class I)